MRIISFGNLFCDYYIKDGSNIFVSGGKSNANILANLSKYFKCAFYGIKGNDQEGKISLKSLEEMNIETSIRTINEETKTRFINGNVVSNICPYCKKEYGYDGNKMSLNDLEGYIEENDYFVIDNLDEFTINVLNKYPNEAFLNLEEIDDIETFGFKELSDILKKRFNIICLNEEVYYYLKDKFLVDSYDLYDSFEPKILIINRSLRGCDIIYDNNFIKKTIEEKIKYVDLNGIGDAFFSEFVRTFIEEKETTEKMISKAFIRALTSISVCAKYLGARGHLIKPYKIKTYNKCICKDIVIDK